MSNPVISSPAEQVQEAVHLLLNAAKEHQHVENRAEPRFPFFQPATLTYRYRQEEPISVFTRELSDTGIGLLHATQVERGEVSITIGERDNAVTFRTFILWCKPCGQWYLSGGQFLGIVR